MKLLTLPGLLLLSLLAHAQTHEAPEKRVYLGINFSPDYSYRALSGDGAQVTSDLIEGRNSIEEAKFGYTQGLSLRYRVTKRLGLETGFLYSNKGYHVPKYNVGIDLFGGNEPSIVQWVVHYRFMEVPLKATYSFSRGKFRGFATAGTTVGKLLQAEHILRAQQPDGYWQTRSTDSSTNFRSPMLSAVVGGGIDYHPNHWLMFRLAPELRYGMHSMVEDAPIQETLFTLGTNAGMYIAVL